MVLPVIVALIYGEKVVSFLITIAACLLIGIPLTIKKPKSRVFYAKEGLISVALGWIALSIMGSLPFVISRQIPHFVDALFEIISGFTTTGSSILSDVEALDYSMIFWRSFSHWIGGMGVLVFILAVLPLAKGESMHIMRAESPGPSVDKLVPRIRTSAASLYGIYIVMTILQVVLLLAGKVPMFDALTLTFGTAGTGGFAIKNTSLMSYSSYSQVIITIFMILFGINFNFYYLILLRKVKESFKMEEVKWYLMIITGSILLISFNVGGIKNFFHLPIIQLSKLLLSYQPLDILHWTIMYGLPFQRQYLCF